MLLIFHWMCSSKLVSKFFSLMTTHMQFQNSMRMTVIQKHGANQYVVLCVVPIPNLPFIKLTQWHFLLHLVHSVDYRMIYSLLWTIRLWKNHELLTRNHILFSQWKNLLLHSLLLILSVRCRVWKSSDFWISKA